MTLAVSRELDLDAPLRDWEQFVEALTDDDIYDAIGTEEAIEALIARSLLQDVLDRGDPDAGTLERVARADRNYLAAAPALLENTRISLYRDDDPPHHWWWKVDEIVLGEKGQVLLSVPEAARAKGVHPHTIRSAIKAGTLPARRLARGFLIHRRDLERWTPMRVGRPRRRASSEVADALLEAFNSANTGGDFAGAHAIARVLRQSPESPRRKLALAIDALNTNDVTDSLRWLDQVDEQQLRPESRETAMLVRAIALLRSGNSEAAVELLTPGSSPVLGWRGWVALAEALLASEGREDDARAAARKAVAAAPGEAPPRYVAARAAWSTNHVWEALEQVTVFRALVPTDPDGIVLHAAILGYLGDTVGDTELYERAEELFVEAMPARPDTLSRLGVVRARLGRWREAITVAEELASAGDDPEDVIEALLAGAAETHSPREIEAAVNAVESVFGESELTRRYATLAKASAADIPGTIRDLEELDPTAGRQRAILAALAHERAGERERAQQLFGDYLSELNKAAAWTWRSYWQIAGVRRHGLFSGHGDATRDLEDFTNRVLMQWDEDAPTRESVWAGARGRISSVVVRTSSAIH